MHHSSWSAVAAVVMLLTVAGGGQGGGGGGFGAGRDGADSVLEKINRYLDDLRCT